MNDLSVRNLQRVCKRTGFRLKAGGHASPEFPEFGVCAKGAVCLAIGVKSVYNPAVDVATRHKADAIEAGFEGWENEPYPNSVLPLNLHNRYIKVGKRLRNVALPRSG